MIKEFFVAIIIASLLILGIAFVIVDGLAIVSQPNLVEL